LIIRKVLNGNLFRHGGQDGLRPTKGFTQVGLSAMAHQLW